MNIKQLANSKTGMVIAAGAVVAALSYLAAKEAKEVVASTGQAFNPVTTITFLLVALMLWARNYQVKVIGRSAGGFMMLSTVRQKSRYSALKRRHI